MLSPIQNLFEVARTEWGLPIRENPISKLKIAVECNRRESRLRDGELDRIIEAAKKTKNPVILPIILFTLQTGLRRSEILSATWNHLDMERTIVFMTLWDEWFLGRGRSGPAGRTRGLHGGRRRFSPGTTQQAGCPQLVATVAAQVRP